MDKTLKQKMIFIIPVCALILTFAWGRFMEGTLTATRDITISSVNVTPNRIYIKGMVPKGRQVTSYGFGYKTQNRLFIDVRSRPNVFSEGERNIVLDEDISNIKQIYLRGGSDNDIKLIGEKAPVISPSEIKQRLNKHHPNIEMGRVWQQLRIKEPNNFFLADNELLYKEFHFNMNSNLTLTIIQVSDFGDFNFQDLVFVPQNKEWVFIGNIDMPNQKGLVPQYRVIKQGNYSWLAVKYQTGSGSGYNCQQEAWYGVYNNKLKEVFRYTYEMGDDSGGPIPTGLTGSVGTIGTEHGLPYVTVKYLVDYCFDEPLITAHYEAHYSWLPAKREFTFDQTKSNCNLKQIDDDFVLLDTEFLAKYEEQLIEISKGHDIKKKNMLKTVLDYYPYSKRQQLRQRFGL